MSVGSPVTGTTVADYIRQNEGAEMEFRLMLKTLAGALLLLVSACATTSPPQSTSAKSSTGNDAEHAYDGQWQVKVRKHAVLQFMPGNWQTRCNGKSFSFNARVVQSQFILRSPEQDEARASVNARGKFQLRAPLKEPARASAGASLGRDQRTLILTGSLRTQRGRFTIGIAEFGNAGCTAKVDFERQS